MIIQPTQGQKYFFCFWMHLLASLPHSLQSFIELTKRPGDYANWLSVDGLVFLEDVYSGKHKKQGKPLEYLKVLFQKDDGKEGGKNRNKVNEHSRTHRSDQLHADNKANLWKEGRKKHDQPY